MMVSSVRFEFIAFEAFELPGYGESCGDFLFSLIATPASTLGNVVASYKHHRIPIPPLPNHHEAHFCSQHDRKARRDLIRSMHRCFCDGTSTLARCQTGRIPRG